MDATCHVPQTLCDGRFIVGEELGHGAYSTVFAGYDTAAKKDVAIKAGPLACQTRHVIKETEIVQELQHKTFPGSNQRFGPAYIWSGQDQVNFYLVMERCGPSLSDILASTGKNAISLPDVATVAHRALQSLETLHFHGFLHCDIKPANICVDATGSKVVFVDFGMATRWHDNATGKHVEKSTAVTFRGTPAYASPHVLSRTRPSRRDDMISLGYTLIKLARGRLPWQRKLASTKCSEMRREVWAIQKSTSIDTLTAGLYPAFATYMRYVLSLKYFEMPDYSVARQIFAGQLAHCGINIERHLFSWKPPVLVPSPRFDDNKRAKKRSRLTDEEQNTRVAECEEQKEDDTAIMSQAKRLRLK